jgi:hypothetical protein
MPVVVVVMIVMIAPAVAIAVVVVIPVVVMIETATAAIPIAGEILVAVVVGSNPSRTFIRRSSPITVVPAIVTPVGIPVALDPYKIGARAARHHRDYARRWRGADLNANGNLRA